MKFKIVGNSLIYIDEGNKIIEGENKYAIIEIETKRYRNKLDLMSLSFRLTATSVSDSTKSACQVLMKSEINENTICLKGEINSDFSAITDKVILMLTGVNSDKIVAKFDSRPITITDDISLDSIPTETTAEQLFNQAQLEAQKAMDAASETREMLDNFTLDIASETVIGGIKSGNDISVSSDGNVTVNSVKGKTIGKSVPADAVFTDTVYTLPKATKNILGGVKVDGTSIIADKNGMISAVGGKGHDGKIILPTASTDTLGGVKVDGKTITAAEDGTITVLENENLKAEIEELKSIIGFTDSDIIGLHADFENNIFTRLGAAVGLNRGSDFDKFPMYGRRRRCNVLDDGTITAYYGDENFVEDGSNGQVMVYQPKFYYKVVPLKLDPITDGYGYHLRSANYYISAAPKSGFKLHPAFYDETENPVDYILFSAYEGSIFDTSENIYLQNDEQVADFSTDKLSSIAGVKPCSGKTQKLTRANIELLSKNRGEGWHSDMIKAESANQMLMIIEYAKFNIQDVIGPGAISVDGISGENCSLNTGGTSSLGNQTGNANGLEKQTSMSYRGMENTWGNMWKLINGINAYMDNNSVFNAYICENCEFTENKKIDNYKNIGYMLSSTDGNISAFGYNIQYDWLFIPSETNGTNKNPVGNHYWCNPKKYNTWRNFPIGGGARSGSSGAFYLSLDYTADIHSHSLGGRIIYLPKSSYSSI